MSLRMGAQAAQCAQSGCRPTVRKHGSVRLFEFAFNAMLTGASAGLAEQPFVFIWAQP